MVVAVRQTNETAEMMMRVSKRKQAQQQAAAAAAAAAKAKEQAAAAKEQASNRTPPAPSANAGGGRKARSLPMTRSNSNATATNDNRTSKRKRKQEAQAQAQAHVTPARSSTSSRHPSNPNNTGYMPLPLPSPIIQPSPIRVVHQHEPIHHSPIHLSGPPPAPSFGEEDFQLLTMGIENMGSMGSIESVAAVAADNFSLDKVEAARGAAAAAVLLSGGTRPQQHVPNGSESTVRGATAATPDSILLNNNNGGSNGEDSIVISSPSVGHSRECENSSAMSHPHSPGSFLLDDSLLDPSKPNNNLSARNSYQDLSSSHSFVQHQGQSVGHSRTTPMDVSFNPSPTLDWECTNMDHFFDDIAPPTITTTTTNSTTVVAAGGGGRSRRKSSFTIDSNGNVGRSLSPKNSNSLFYTDSFQQFVGPLASSFGMFGSLSNSSSADYLNIHTPQDHLMATTATGTGTTIATSASVKLQTAPQPRTLALSPRNRLTSPQRRSAYPPQSPHLSSDAEEDDDDGEAPSSNAHTNTILIGNEYSHPSRGTLEHYNNDLYNQLKHASPPPRNDDAQLPPLLIPHDQYRGNRLAIVRGSLGQTLHYEMEDNGASSSSAVKTYAFYKFLREIHPALEGCIYLLPGLQRQLQQRQRSGGRHNQSMDEDDDGTTPGCTINVSEFGRFKLGHLPGMTKSQMSKLSKSDVAIAKKRIECAICAFGGTLRREQQSQQQKKRTQQIIADKQSIFRTRKESSSIIAASSSSGRSSSTQVTGNKRKSRQHQHQQLQHHQHQPVVARSNSTIRRERYEKKLRQQYFEHGNRLSWDVQSNLALTLNGAKTFDDDDANILKMSGSKDEKRKNRCKKCGQIKQGHDCPYASSLQRSIGVMVFPAANAHVANEPGTLAPALCDMNNFISIKSGSFEASSSSPEKRQRTLTATAKSEMMPNKGDAAAAVHETSPFRRKSLLSTPTITCTTIDEKRSDTEEERDDMKAEAEDLLFQPKMEITLDQYRAVTPSHADSSSSSRRRGGYKYPQVPLTFSQRKSMSDTLFSLSKQVPKLMDECAAILTEARKRDEWDLAVAELMTQVICVLHCSSSNDYTLEGVRRYLLTLGIVC